MNLLQEMILYPHQRVEPGHRVLEDQSDLLAPNPPIHLIAELGEVSATKQDLPRHKGPRRKDSENRFTQCRLSAACFANNAESLSLLHDQLDSVEGPDLASSRLVVDREVLYSEERLRVSSSPSSAMG